MADTDHATEIASRGEALPTPPIPRLDTDPPLDCTLCPRLVALRREAWAAHPEWFNAPVPTWEPAGGPNAVRMVVVGMAPGLKGANRTGRPFTGDHAGHLLYRTLGRFGFARGTFDARPDDGLEPVDCAVTNAVRCVPPQNKPVGAEVNNCRPFLVDTLARYGQAQVLVTLGKIAHDTLVRALGGRVAAAKFGHGAEHEVAGWRVVSSYHCSRYNTNTGVLTEEMFDAVFARVRALVDENRP